MKHILTLLIIIASLHVSPSRAAVGALPEYTLKAAYLYNFALLTDWPKSDIESTQFNLCIYSKNDFGGSFDVLGDKQIANKTVKITHLTEPTDTSKCQLVFIPKNRETNGEKLIKHLSSMPILLVSDDQSLEGTHIQILQNKDRLTFSINTRLLEKIGLNLSSRLLNLAKEVK